MQEAESIHLCQGCTDSLTSAYIFWQRVKQSDENISTIELDQSSTDEGQAKKQRLAEEIEFVATDDVDIEHYLISNGTDSTTTKDNGIAIPISDSSKRKARKPKPPKETDAADSGSSGIGENIALPHFLITECPTSEDDRAKDDDDLSSADETDKTQSSAHSKPVKTLTASMIVPTSLAQINELCVTTLQTEDDSQSIYKCNHCPKAFAAPYHLMIHMRKSHLCQYCLATFSKINDLYDHVKETHQSFDCLLCSKEFQSNGNLRQHMRKNHSIFLPAHISLLNLQDINK